MLLALLSSSLPALASPASDLSPIYANLTPAADYRLKDHRIQELAGSDNVPAQVPDINKESIFQVALLPAPPLESTSTFPEPSTITTTTTSSSSSSSTDSSSSSSSSGTIGSSGSSSIGSSASSSPSSLFCPPPSSTNLSGERFAAEAEITDQSVVLEAWEVVNETFFDARNKGWTPEAWAAKKEAILRKPPKSRGEAYAMISSMLASLNDPYSRFVSPKQFAALAKYDVTGIGLNIGEDVEDGRVKLKVVGIVLGSPAQLAGELAVTRGKYADLAGDVADVERYSPLCVASSILRTLRYPPLSASSPTSPPLPPLCPLSLPTHLLCHGASRCASRGRARIRGRHEHAWHDLSACPSSSPLPPPHNSRRPSVVSPVPSPSRTNRSAARRRARFIGWHECTGHVRIRCIFAYPIPFPIPNPLPLPLPHCLGVRQGDELVSVDGTSVQGISAFDVSSLIQGPKGTPVTVAIRHDSCSPIEFLTMARTSEVQSPVLYRLDRNDPISPLGLFQDFSSAASSSPSPSASSSSSSSSMFSSVFSSSSAPTGPVGYIRLKEFNAAAKRDVVTAIQRLEAAGATSFVLDLQDNPGGLVQSGVEIAKLFLERGQTVVYTEARPGDLPQKRSIEATGKPLTRAPLTVLVNGRTASASEIVAGALHDNCRAVLVGSRTFGKGLIQSVYELNDGSGMVVTVGKYVTPGLVDIDGNGIAADFRRKPSGDMARWKLANCKVPSS
ncbi:unnamed protein product [Closterium sp. NIES-53]